MSIFERWEKLSLDEKLKGSLKGELSKEEEELLTRLCDRFNESQEKYTLYPKGLAFWFQVIRPDIPVLKMCSYILQQELEDQLGMMKIYATYRTAARATALLEQMREADNNTGNNVKGGN